jgi:hypothetical protein
MKSRSAWMMRSGQAAAVVAASFLLSWSPATAAPDPGLQGGWAVNDSGYVSFPHSTYDQLWMVDSAGAGWVRINFRLSGCFSNWTSTQTCRGDGDQSQWTANNTENTGGNGNNTYIGNFVSNAAKPLANHFKTRITEWEIWNEPNAWWFNQGTVYSGGSFLYPSNYAQLLKRSRDAIKSISPSARIIFGGLLAHDADAVQATVVDEQGRVRRVRKRGDVPSRRPEDAGNQQDQRGGEPSGDQAVSAAALPCPDAVGTTGASYLRDTYNMGRRKARWKAGDYPFHHVGQHLYLTQGSNVSACLIRNYLQDLRNVMLEPANEGPSTTKKIHVTEIGWEAGDDAASRDRQRANLQTAFQEFSAQSKANVVRAYWFNVQDIPEGGLWFGLRTGGDFSDGFAGAPKPAWDAYRTYASFCNVC